jgi:hypothetical protein
MKAERVAASAIEFLAYLLVEPLKARGRWADIGRLYQNPLEELSRAYKSHNELVPLPPAGLPPTTTDALTGGALDNFRADVAVLYASLRAAGRISEAKAVRQEALRLDPSEEMRVALEHAPIRYD